MKIYSLDEDAFKKLEGVLKDLYGYGEVLTADKRCDLAHRLGRIVDELWQCETLWCPACSGTGKLPDDKTCASCGADYEQAF